MDDDKKKIEIIFDNDIEFDDDDIIFDEDDIITENDDISDEDDITSNEKDEPIPIEKEKKWEPKDGDSEIRTEVEEETWDDSHFKNRKRIRIKKKKVK